MSPDQWFTMARVVTELGIGVFVFYVGLARKQQAELWQKELLFRDQQLEQLTDEMQALRAHVDHGTSKCSERTGQIQQGIWAMTERLVRLETLLEGDRRRTIRERGSNS